MDCDFSPARTIEKHLDLRKVYAKYVSGLDEIFQILLESSGPRYKTAWLAYLSCHLLDLDRFLEAVYDICVCNL